MHRDVLKKIRKTLTLMKKSLSLSHKTHRNLRELSLICEKDQSFVFDGFENLLNSVASSRSQHINDIDMVTIWESQIIKSRKISQRKMTPEEQKEIEHLISLGVPKAKICKKHNITYSTLQKYLAIKEPSDNEGSHETFN